jgi:protein arginine N-methyltransferase 2
MDVESIDFVGSQDGDGARCEQAEGDNSNIEDVKAMIDASCHGRMHVIQTLVSKNGLYASMQDQVTGQSPLMAAASAGNHALCQYLLDAGAPWNALDRQGRCAGDYATAAEQWSVVNLLVEWGVRAELILGQLDRTHREKTSSGISSAAAAAAPSDGLVPVDQQPSTKPDYLRQRLQYSEDGQSLLDQDQDAVMMEWERPLMKAHAQIMMEEGRRSVMNVGFGMGIIDSALQEYQPDLHIIIEAHQDVYRRMLEDGWDRKPNVRLCFGRWQDVVPRLREEKITVDSIFFDTVSFV